MKQKKMNRLWAVLLSFFMVLSLLPSPPALAEGEEGTTTDGLVINKTATLEDDGTYTIDLDAYAKGTTTTSQVQEAVPLDIVLVIDQSGSMDKVLETKTEYAYEEDWYDEWYYSDFSEYNDYYYLADDGNYYKVQRGSYSSGGKKKTTYYYLYYVDSNNNTVYLVGNSTSNTRPSSYTSQYTTIYYGTLYTQYSTTKNITRLDAAKSAVNNFVTAIQKNAAETKAEHRIAIVGFASGNDTDMSGYNGTRWENTELFVDGTSVPYAKNSNAESTSITNEQFTRALVNINVNGNINSNITNAISSLDANGGTFTSYGIEMANKIFANNSIENTTRQRVVVVFTDGEPGASGFDENTANKAILNGKTTKNDYKANLYTVGLFSSTPSNGSDVNKFMNYLSSNYPSAQSMTNAGNYVKDSHYYMTATDASSLNNVFQSISKDVSESDTTVTLGADTVMKDIIANEFKLPADFDVSKNVKVTTYASTDGTKGDTTTTSSEVNVSKNVAEDGTASINVTNFDYAKKYVTSGHAGEILHVTIKGLLPNDSAVTGDPVSTNGEESGIYGGDGTLAAKFPQPKTRLAKKNFVLDYAKTTTLSDFGTTAKAVAADDFRAVSSADTTADGKFGKAVLANNNLTYTPQAMNWNDVDKYYLFGTYTGEADTEVAATNDGKIWTKVNVIPANNVYYEDDFVTTEDGATIGIKYSEGNWKVDGSSDNNSGAVNTENDNNAHGWIESKDDDTTYSDGTAHGATAKYAYAQFTFTGTAVDIYSRTNATSGKVKATLRAVNSDGTVGAKVQTYIMDNYAETGDYYQIPTAFFKDLKYGTYQVTLQVYTDVKEGSDYVYYIDGIRVYNPLGTSTEITEGSAAYEAYKSAGELNAVFANVRELLLADAVAADSETIKGVVYIDENSASTSSAAVYNTIGPKNEVYLSQGQSIAFGVSGESDSKYYIGFKGPKGTTQVTVSNGEGTKTVTVNGASDQYFEVVPNSKGFIQIENSGSNLLSVTKIRMTGTSNAGVISTNYEELMKYVAEFDNLKNEESVENPDNTTEVDPGEVEITNPSDDTTKDNTSTEKTSSLKDIFSQIAKWFRGRR